DYLETIGAELVAGRSFSEDFSSDYTEAYVINEAAAQFLELEDPVDQPLIGSAFTGSEWSRKYARIVGIVKDFHFASLHDKIRPVVFSLSSDVTMPMSSMLVRISPENIEGSIAQIEEVWQTINPDVPFRYLFLDEEIQEHYQQEARFLNVFSSFTTLSIFIGCLGLFGLTAFIMKKRTKEIGIRKVLGANPFGLFKVLSSSFIRLVLIASFLGMPITLWLMGSWLENFEYRITIGWWVFILTALGSLVAAVATITYHSLKVARVNPVETIKHE
ncbi:MAG: FtsX-like permease family protein, partial [Bacteroidota bacterium]